MRRQLLHAQSNTLLLIVKAQDHDIQLLINLDKFLWMSYAAVAHVRDVNQTVDTSQVHKDTIRSDVLDCAFEYLTHFEALDDETLLLFELSLNQGLVRYDHIFELLIDFDNLEFHLLSDILVKITDRFHINLRTRQERLESKHVDNQTTLGAALHRTLDDHILFLGCVDLIPCMVDAGRFVAHNQLTMGILLLFDVDGHLVTSLQLRIVTEF